MNDELFDNPGEKLEDALAILATGLSIEEILAETGNDAEWLRPLLELAAEVGDLQQAIPVPSPEASLQKFLAYGEDLAGTSQPAISAQPDGQTALSKLIKSWWSRLFIGFVVVLLIGGPYAFITMNTAVIESISPTETPLPASTVTPTATPVLILIPTDPPATSTATLTPDMPTATRRPVSNSTSDTIKLPPTPTANVTPAMPFIEPTPTNPLSTDDNQDEDDTDGVDNIPTPTATATIPLIEPTPANDTTDDGNDNTNENDSDGNASDDNNNDNGNSGPGGGDDNDNSDDNSGSGNSGSNDGGDDKDNSGSGGGDDDDD